MKSNIGFWINRRKAVMGITILLLVNAAVAGIPVGSPGFPPVAQAAPTSTINGRRMIW